MSESPWRRFPASVSLCTERSSSLLPSSSTSSFIKPGRSWFNASSSATFHYHHHHQQQHQCFQFYHCQSTVGLFSPPGFTIPKGLYFTAEVFSFFFFFRRLISEVTEQISTKLGLIFYFYCYFKKLDRTPGPGHLPPPAGGKNCFMGTNSELWLNVSLQQNMISTIWKKLVNLQGLPYMSPNFVNFGPETAMNDWRVFAHPLNFRIGGNFQPYCMHSQQANFGTCYVIART